MDCMVVITSCYPSISDIAFCKLGDKSWTVINTRLFSLPISVVHYEGSLYITGLKSINGWIYEIGSISSPVMIRMPQDTVQFFVATSSQLLLFSGLFSGHPYLDLEEFYKNRYWIYEFFPRNQLNLSRNRRLSLVKSLVDKPRFRSWFLYRNFIVCTKNISGCQEDCIYVDVSEPGGFVYEYEIDDDAHEIDDDAFKIDVLNLKTGNYEHISCGRKEPRSRKLLHSVWVELSL
ncbi:putative F-box protein SKIP23 [Cocos nucifera]|uniref:Putative F-box protein SKIP23 n=1 Tax=Cocos nucifera TaxID=13894 RepID=A0A8K0IE78_COCNU|nr:putative F-box protein SKIP23 [Cocos nucifera]